jgi:hypothetical protein
VFGSLLSHASAPRLAQLNGCYQSIGEGGLIADALQTLTGAHARTLAAHRMSWTDLQATAEDPHAFVGAGTRNNESEEHMNGIVGGHAYSILHAVEVPAGDEGGELHLVQLRNPWGHGEWKGPWSDGSREWSRRKDAARAVGDKNKDEDDGSFWMAHEDFTTRYATVDFCRLSTAQRKGRNAIHELAQEEAAAGAEGCDEDWLSGIGGGVPKKKKGGGKKKKGKKH